MKQYQVWIQLSLMAIAVGIIAYSVFKESNPGLEISSPTPVIED